MRVTAGIRKWVAVALVLLVAVLAAPAAAAAATPPMLDQTGQQTSQQGQQVGQQGGQQNSSGSGQTGGFELDRNAFNIFGSGNNDVLNTSIGRFLARLLVRLLVISFDVSLVIAIAMLFFEIVLMLVGKQGHGTHTVQKRLVDMGLGIALVLCILTGVMATAINYLLKSGQEIQQDLSGSGAPAPVVAMVDRPGSSET